MRTAAGLRCFGCERTGAVPDFGIQERWRRSAEVHGSRIGHPVARQVDKVNQPTQWTMVFGVRRAPLVAATGRSVRSEASSGFKETRSTWCTKGDTSEKNGVGGPGGHGVLLGARVVRGEGRDSGSGFERRAAGCRSTGACAIRRDLEAAPRTHAHRGGRVPDIRGERQGACGAESVARIDGGGARLQVPRRRHDVRRDVAGPGRRAGARVPRAW